MWNEKSQTTMIKGTHKWLPQKWTQSQKQIDYVNTWTSQEKILIKKNHKTPNNIGPKGSQQHGGHFKWT